jgi:hypothetical protein
MGAFVTFRNCFVFGFGLFTLHINSQTSPNYIDYLNLANRAEYLFLKGNYDSTNTIFRHLEKDYGKLKHKDNLYYGISSYSTNDSLNGFSHISKYFLDVGTLSVPDYREKFPKMNISEYAVSKLTLLEKEQKTRYERELKAKYMAIADTIVHFEKLDQANRPSPEEIDTLADIVVQRNLLRYLKNYGIPPAHIVADGWLTVLFHVRDKEVMNEYLDFFNEKIRSGEAPPFTVAILTDRGLNNGTVYGSYFTKATSQKDKERINENRRKIGMSIYFNGSNDHVRLSDRNMDEGYNEPKKSEKKKGKPIEKTEINLDQSGVYIDGKRVNKIECKDFKKMEIVFPYDSSFAISWSNYLWISLENKKDPSSRMIAGVNLMRGMIEQVTKDGYVTFPVFADEKVDYKHPMNYEFAREVQVMGKPIDTGITKDSLFVKKASVGNEQIFSFWIEAVKYKGVYPIKNGEKQRFKFDTMFVSPIWKIQCIGTGNKCK